MRVRSTAGESSVCRGEGTVVECILGLNALYAHPYKELSPEGSFSWATVIQVCLRQLDFIPVLHSWSHLSNFWSLSFSGLIIFISSFYSFIKYLPAFQQNSVCARICVNRSVTVPHFALVPNDLAPLLHGVHTWKIKTLKGRCVCQTFSFKAR